MRPTFLARRDYLGLKAAFRELVDLAGGQTAAARVARVSQQQLGRYCSTADEFEDCFPPADVVADLEAECGQPVLTRFMAALAGHDLHRRDPDRKSALLALFGEITSEAAETVGRIAADLADGVISEEEAAAQRKHLGELMDALGRYDAALARIEGSQTVVQMTPTAEQPRSGAANGARPDQPRSGARQTFGRTGPDRSAG